MEAELLGTVKAGALVLDGSGESMRLEGSAPEGHGRVKGRVRREGGTTVLSLR